MKQLQNLKWSPKWVSHLGCIKGCLDYLGLDISEAWLFGGTGHAFVINVHDVVCPSGPTAWRTVRLFELAPNLGYKIEGTFGFKDNPGFAERQKEAWTFVQEAIDRGIPCYGWELDVPEYYVIYGYHEGDSETPAGYYYSGPMCDDGAGPKPWQEVGDTGIGVLEMYSVEPGQPAGDAKTVREALRFALKHAENPSEWIFERYRAGLAGYDNWIGALEAGKANGHGMAYNAAVWSECRAYAVAFLREARGRLDGTLEPLFDEAIAHYQAVSNHLAQVAKLYPFKPPFAELVAVDAQSQAAVEALRMARQAEAAGLVALGKIVQAL